MKGGHVEEYEGIVVTWIAGHTPELNVLSDEGQLIETVKLAEYSLEGLHDLMLDKGFKKKTETSSN